MTAARSLRLLARAWYYFRLGYSTYLTFLLGYASTLVTVYYLAIRNMPDLLSMFPHFEPFAVLATLIGIPLSIAIGWIHLKRSNLMASEQDIATEANPYTYRLPGSGISKDLWFPSILMELRIVRRLAETNGLLTDSEKMQIDEMEQKFMTLLKGGYVGVPRRSSVIFKNTQP